MKTIAFVVCAALFLLFAESPLTSIPVAADQTIQVDVTLAAPDGTTNPCNGEAVVLTGSMHIVGPVTLFTDGSVQENYHLNSHFDGIGALGNKYVLDAEENTQTTFAAGLADKIWATSSYKLVNQTSAQNFELIIVFRETIPGAPVVKNADSSCRG